MASSMIRQYIIGSLTGDYLTIITVVWILGGFLASGGNWVLLVDLSVLIQSVYE